MTVSFRPAVREQTSLLIGIAGPSGSGKTMSALRLATGLAGGGKVAMIDTEAGRGLHYSGMFAFDHADLKPPFRPDAYVDAIKAADAAGYKVIIIDSTSHEWAGEGGILDWHEEEMQRMAGDDWKRREAVKMAAWIKPKMGHKHMVQAILQVRASIIFCLRAEEKVAMVKDDKGKTQIVPQGFQPICAKDFMYEMTASMLLLPTAPGIPQPIKLQQQHAHAFPAGQPISEDTGRLLGEWANGGEAPAKTATETPLQAAEKAADEGTEALRAWWSGEGRPHQAALAGDLARLKEMAARADPKPEGGEPDKPSPSVNEARRDKIMAMLDEAGDSGVALDSVIRTMGGVLKKMNEEAPELYDEVMKSAQERRKW
ncbi:MAG: AAA family ATPase [Rhodospirillaceae bacterium]